MLDEVAWLLNLVLSVYMSWLIAAASNNPSTQS
jgi:hypothetical protein